jgi:NTE family protein
MTHRWLAACSSIVVGLSTLCGPSLAEPAPSPARPRVGLVLSGGGARGIAHIGVLRVLEERRVPVDLITGTSMGSIIGGLYAAGYSPDEMADIIDGIDWADSFDDDPPRAQRSFRRKQDDLDYLTSLELGLREGAVALPWGLVQGQKLNLILRRLFLRVAAIDDFDELHVPFRAVSTDVVTGQPVVHESGDLATAIRASMSLPGVFAPVEHEGKLLIDGGVSNNTPVDLALAMGADVLIVVDVGTPLDPKEEITNAGAVIGQLVSLMVVSTTQRQLALMRPGDILIRPDLEGVSTASFELGSPVALRGETAARADLAALDRLAVGEAEHAQRIAAQRHGAVAALRIARVKVENDSRLRNDVLEARLETRGGKDLDVAGLEADLQDIYGLDTFERVDYRVEPQPESRPAPERAPEPRAEPPPEGASEPEPAAGEEQYEEVNLAIEAREKSWGPAYLRVGINLEENFENTSNYNLAFNYTVRPVNGLGAEWRNDLVVGSTQRLATEFWQPLDAESRWFIAPSFEFLRETFPIYDGDDRTGEFIARRTNVGFDFGREFSNWGELRAGLIFDIGHARTVVGTPDQADHFRTGGFYVRLAVDTLDGVHFPRSGTSSGAAFGLVRKELGAEDSYEIAFGGLAHAFTFRKNTILLSAQGQTVWDADQATANLARLGGFQRLSGLDRYQLAGRHSTLFRVLAYRQVAAPGALSFSYPLYAGLSFESGNVSARRTIFAAAGRAAPRRRASRRGHCTRIPGARTMRRRRVRVRTPGRSTHRFDWHSRPASPSR